MSGTGISGVAQQDVGTALDVNGPKYQGWDGRRAAQARSWQARAPPSSQTHNAILFKSHFCSTLRLVATPHRHLPLIPPGPVAAQQRSTSTPRHCCSAPLGEFQGIQFPLTTPLSYSALPGKFTSRPKPRGSMYEVLVPEIPGQSMHVK